MCLLKELSSLSWTSAISIVSDIILVIIIIVSAPGEASHQDISSSLKNMSIFSPNIFAGIGTISFAFVCQHNSFMVYRSLKEPTLANWRFVVHLSVGFSLGLSLSLGIVAYVSFNEHTMGNVLNNFPATSTEVTFARSLLALCMTFVFPMECYVSRHCLMSMIDKLLAHRRASDALTGGFDLINSTRVSGATSSNENIEMNIVGFSDKSGDSSCTIRGLDNTIVDCIDGFGANGQRANGPADYSSAGAGRGEPSQSEVLAREVPAGSRLATLSDEIGEGALRERMRRPVTLLLWGLALLIAILSKKLGVVLALTGVASALELCVLYYALLFSKQICAGFAADVYTNIHVVGY